MILLILRKSTKSENPDQVATLIVWSKLMILELTLQQFGGYFLH